MSKHCQYIFVLWGNEFEEATASIFITVLREAGLRVKVVGLTRPYICGSHGLVLLPDLTLDQALPLARNAVCVIIPYTSCGIRRLKNDPRIREFCHRAYANQAKFVLGQLDGISITDLDLLPSSVSDFLIYPDHENLVTFAQGIAKSLGCVQNG